jgi:hypothetical protein
VTFGVRNVASNHGFLAGNLTNLWHFILYFSLFHVKTHFSNPHNPLIHSNLRVLFPQSNPYYTRKIVQSYYFFFIWPNIFSLFYKIFAQHLIYFARTCAYEDFLLLLQTE